MMTKLNKLPWKVMAPILAISIFAVSSYAANVSVETVTYAGQGGVNFIVSNGFTVADSGFHVAQADDASSSLPAAWLDDDVVNTALTAGNWYYELSLTLGAAAAIDHTYTVTVQWNTGSGYSSLTPLTFTTAHVIEVGETMKFRMDTGVTSFSAPTAITIVVA
jgi:hypothetical protein